VPIHLKIVIFVPILLRMAWVLTAFFSPNDKLNGRVDDGNDINKNQKMAAEFGSLGFERATEGRNFLMALTVLLCVCKIRNSTRKINHAKLMSER